MQNKRLAWIFFMKSIWKHEPNLCRIGNYVRTISRRKRFARYRNSDDPATDAVTYCWGESRDAVRLRVRFVDRLVMIARIHSPAAGVFSRLWSIPVRSSLYGTWCDVYRDQEIRDMGTLDINLDVVWEEGANSFSTFAFFTTSTQRINTASNIKHNITDLKSRPHRQQLRSRIDFAASACDGCKIGTTRRRWFNNEP